MKRRNKFLKLAAVLLAAVVFASGTASVTVSADTPYLTYTVDGYGRMQETQTAYLAQKTLTKFGEEFLGNPNDIFITDDGEIYVADSGEAADSGDDDKSSTDNGSGDSADTDSGTESSDNAASASSKADSGNDKAASKNGRILVGNANGELIKIIGDGILKSPQGIFLTKDKHLYVADPGAKKVFIFDENDKLIGEYGKPDSPLYGETLDFLPIKIVVNDAGDMYIVCQSNTNGVVQISPVEGGTFLGYFGANFTSVDFKTIMYRAIMTDEQRAKMVQNLPSTPDNLAIDEKGLIYTVTRGDGDNTLKRLNIAGTNMIKTLDGYYDDLPAAVAVGNHDNIYVASKSGYIYEYNNDGELIYVFAGSDDGTHRVGLSTMVSSIQVDKNDHIYILDSDKSQIQIYEPSEFTSLLHNALYLYAKGRYTASKEPLGEVLKMNSMFDYANKAMGRAFYQEENYDEALSYAKLANDREGYSDAYWEIRNVWLKNNIIALLLAIVLIYIVFKIIKFFDKKIGILKKPREIKDKIFSGKFMSNFAYSKYFMKHPIDGSYGIAREGRASWSAPTLLLVIFMAEYIINKYLCGFLQKTIREGRYEIFSDIGIVVVVIVGLSACNYLVCTINEGEGTVKKIYTYFCYSLLPYVVLTPVSFVLSHILTTNEQFLITLVNIVMVVWVVVLALLGIKEVNNYTAKETAKVIGLTAFTIVIVALLIFIIYVLWAQVFEFISAIFGEVVYRLGY